MAYETGSSSDPGDLLVKLWDFLGLQGWTVDQDISSSGQSPAYGHISNVSSPESDQLISTAMSWDSDTIVLHPNRGFNNSPSTPNDHVNPWASNVWTSQSFWVGVYNIPGPHSTYHFFENDSYCHVVLEYATGFYRHFGMGRMNKFGKWLGGEYYYGHSHAQDVNSIDNWGDIDHYPPWSGYHRQTSAPGQGPAIYGTQMDGSPFPWLTGSPNSKWHTEGYTSVGSDGDGAARGAAYAPGYRRGFFNDFYGVGVTTYNNFRPLIPISVYAYDAAPAPDDYRLLGYLPDIRHVSMQGLTPGETFSVGGDTWFAFPVVRKGNFPGTDTEFSRNSGLAYKQVT